MHGISNNCNSQNNIDESLKWFKTGFSSSGHSFIFVLLFSQLMMRLGVDDLSSRSRLTGSDVRISSFIAHPKYNRTSYFDVAIAVAERFIEFTSTIRPICLPFQPIDDFDQTKGDFLNLAGFGDKDKNGNSVDSHLQLYNYQVKTLDFKFLE